MGNFIRHNSDLWLALALIGVAVYTGCNVFPQVRFDRERIEIWVAPQQIQVSGLYHYRNPSLLPAWLSLGLPFPVDAEHPRPSLYSIATVTDGGRFADYIRPTERRGEVRFRVLLLPYEEKWVQVNYVQGTSVPRGAYILVTTRKWRHPLDRGDYFLHLSPGLDLASTNYRFDVAPVGEKNAYSFTKTDFYPSEDWAFSWRGITPTACAGSK
ncbi:MAG: hypothetical protein ABSA27_17905 [Terriglobales bacterium]